MLSISFCIISSTAFLTRTSFKLSFSLHIVCNGDCWSCMFFVHLYVSKLSLTYVTSIFNELFSLGSSKSPPSIAGKCCRSSADFGMCYVLWSSWNLFDRFPVVNFTLFWTIILLQLELLFEWILTTCNINAMIVCSCK